MDKNRLKKLISIYIYDEKFIELFIAMIEIVWGIWFFSQLFFTPTYIESYHVMSYIAPLWIWGLLAICMGIIHLIFLIISNNEKRKTMAFYSLIFWIFVPLSIGLSSFSPILILYLLMSFSSIIAYMQLSG